MFKNYLTMSLVLCLLLVGLNSANGAVKLSNAELESIAVGCCGSAVQSASFCTTAGSPGGSCKGMLEDCSCPNNDPGCPTVHHYTLKDDPGDYELGEMANCPRRTVTTYLSTCNGWFCEKGGCTVHETTEQSCGQYTQVKSCQ